MTTRETCGQNQLIHVSGRDVLLGAPDTTHVVGTTVPGNRRRIFSRPRTVRQAAAQRADHLVPQGTPLLLRAGMNQGNPAGQVIKNQQRAWRHVVQGRNTTFESGSGGQSLEEAHHVV